MTAPEPGKAPATGPLLRLFRGHSPNCSSSGSVVGVVLVSTVAAAAVLNAAAGRLSRWPTEPPLPPGSGLLPRLRRELWGAILAFGDGDRLHITPEAAEAAAAAGALPVGPPHPDAPAGALSAPSEVHLSLSGRCSAPCAACYLSARPDAPAPDLAALRATLRELAELGVFEVAFGGGETHLQDWVLDLAREARALGLVPNLTTSGLGLTAERAAAMAGLFGQVNVSLDGLEPVYSAVRGWAGASLGLGAIAHLRAAGVRVGVNTVMSRPLLQTPGALQATGEAIAAAGAAEWLWLRFKPAGRGAEAWARLAPDPDDLLALFPAALALEAKTGLQLRADCALIPFLVQHDLPSERLVALGVQGCPGGESLLTRDSDGRWAPCSFTEGSFTEGAAAPSAALAWRSDPTLTAWRARAAAPPLPCGDCPYRAVCRGGCRVVAAHLTGDPLAPDPQCPRVIAHAAGAATDRRA